MKWERFHFAHIAERGTDHRTWSGSGDMLPQIELEEAIEAAQASNIFFSIGTSALSTCGLPVRWWLKRVQSWSRSTRSDAIYAKR